MHGDHNLVFEAWFKWSYGR